MSETIPGKLGQVVVPISARAIDGLDAQAIADRVAPYALAAAAKAGGTIMGAPELLTADELLSRTDLDGFRKLVEDTSPGSLYLLAEMMPTDQAREVIARRRTDKGPASALIVPPVRPGRRR